MGDSLFCRTTFSLLGPARPSTLSTSSPAFLLLRLPSAPRSLSRSRSRSAPSSSSRIASRSGGTTSQSASYPRRMFARRFCSDWMWFARFWDGERRAGFGADAWLWAGEGEVEVEVEAAERVPDADADAECACV